MKTKLLLLALFTAPFISISQVQFWSDTFEDTGAPSTGTRTPSIAEFNACPNTSNTTLSDAYFKRTGTAGIQMNNGTYSAFEGSKFWAAEDIDKGPTCVNNSISANQQLIWSNINISGKSNLAFKGLFAGNNVNGGYQGLWWVANGPNQQDFISVEYSIDGGPWTTLIGFYSSNGTTSAGVPALSLDTNGDKIGDSTSIGYAFQEFMQYIPGTGTTLNLRMNCFVNASLVQEIAFDNFRLFENALDTDDFEAKNNFNFSPNPSNGILKINSNFDGELIIVNQLGQTVKTFNVNSNSENTVNLESLSKGIYILKNVNSNKILSKKLIIN